MPGVIVRDLCDLLREACAIAKGLSQNVTLSRAPVPFQDMHVMDRVLYMYYIRGRGCLHRNALCNTIQVRIQVVSAS